MNPVAGGAVSSISNPYYHLWWATAGVALLSRSGASLGVPGQAVFFGGHVAGDLSWYVLVSCMIHFGRGFLTDFRYRALLCGLAAMILGFGVYFVWEGAFALRAVYLSAV